MHSQKVFHSNKPPHWFEILMYRVQTVTLKVLHFIQVFYTSLHFVLYQISKTSPFPLVGLRYTVHGLLDRALSGLCNRTFRFLLTTLYSFRILIYRLCLEFFNILCSVTFYGSNLQCCSRGTDHFWAQKKTSVNLLRICELGLNKLQCRAGFPRAVINITSCALLNGCSIKGWMTSASTMGLATQHQGCDDADIGSSSLFNHQRFVRLCCWSRCYLDICCDGAVLIRAVPSPDRAWDKIRCGPLDNSWFGDTTLILTVYYCVLTQYLQTGIMISNYLKKSNFEMWSSHSCLNSIHSRSTDNSR